MRLQRARRWLRTRLCTVSSSPTRMRARRRLIPCSSAPASSMASTFPVARFATCVLRAAALPGSLWSARGLTAATSSRAPRRGSTCCPPVWQACSSRIRIFRSRTYPRPRSTSCAHPLLACEGRAAKRSAQALRVRAKRPGAPGRVPHAAQGYRFEHLRVLGARTLVRLPRAPRRSRLALPGARARQPLGRSGCGRVAFGRAGLASKSVIRMRMHTICI